MDPSIVLDTPVEGTGKREREEELPTSAKKRKLPSNGDLLTIADKDETAADSSLMYVEPNLNTNKQKKKRGKKRIFEDINDNPFNQIDQIKYLDPSKAGESKRINDKQVNMLIAEISTQANINTINESKNLLKRGNIVRSKSNRKLEIKCKVRGLITDKGRKNIEKILKIKKNELLSRVILAMNQLYIAGCYEVFKIYKAENVKLRLSEGIDIRGREPKLLKQPTDPP